MAPENPIMEPQEEKLDRIQKKVNKLKAFYALTKSSGENDHSTARFR
jgi:hypothetical protein